MIFKNCQYKFQANPKPPYTEDCLKAVLFLHPKMTEEMYKNFVEADRTYRHQHVLDIRNHTVVSLTPDNIESDCMDTS